METLRKDELFLLGIELDLPNLLKFCSSSKKINSSLCQNDDIWLYKLKEFPKYKRLNVNLSLKDTYILLFNLTKMREKLDLAPNIYWIYSLRELDLSNSFIKTIPKEIGILSNLETLYLYNNQIEMIPKEICDLSNLESLYLYNNQIEMIPNEIGNLSKLRILNLSKNKIETIPNEIGNLLKLQRLYLSNNDIKMLPKEIDNLTDLQILDLFGNKMKIPKKFIKLQPYRE